MPMNILRAVLTSRRLRTSQAKKATIRGVRIRGVHAEPTEEAVADTTGYRLDFTNGRNLYHCSDTGFSPTLLEAAPMDPALEILLVCINGKWGNLDVGEAVSLTNAVKPRLAIPNHYDMMTPNREDPEKYVRDLAASVIRDLKLAELPEFDFLQEGMSLPNYLVQLLLPERHQIKENDWPLRLSQK